MNRKIILLLALMLAALAAVPAFAYEFSADCRGGVRWNNSTVTWRPSLVSFPLGSGWYQAIDAARVAWNSYAPGGNYRIAYTWDSDTNVTFNDNRNTIVMPATWDSSWDPYALALTFKRRSMCYVWPGPDADWVEADTAFNRNYAWETSLNPVGIGGSPYNATIVAMHEHGHGFGLAHENDGLATMNEYYPDGGTIGNGYLVQPHADDTKADRALYGTSSTQRDVASFAYRVASIAAQYPGTTELIPAPVSSFRNAPIALQFSVENRGTTDQSSVPVYFYLSPTRNGVTTSSYFIGSATLSLNSGVTTTPYASITIPSNAPTGYQYIGWIIDPLNSITESDENNNGVTLYAPTLIYANRAPTACFTANPHNGQAPQNVQFNAGCSSDPDGGTLTYSWDFGDGWTDEGVTVSHWFDAGPYEVTLTVTDSSGASATSVQNFYFFPQCTGFNCPAEPL
jgi:PKD repeat protein